MFSQDEAIQKPQADKKKIEIQYKTWLQKKKTIMTAKNIERMESKTEFKRIGNKKKEKKTRKKKKRQI